MNAAEFPELDIFQTPLKNLNLVEASAGTGKTWAITGLYVRLIVERHLTVEQILVVTYTKAATAELRERIRRRLAQALIALETRVAEDLFCAKLLKLNAETDERELAARRLNLAIRNFDEGAIFTIHGFCQRVLNESAFESGMEFDRELTPDEAEIIREIVDDFWRRETTCATGLWVRFLADGGQTPDAWREAIRGHLGKPYLNIAPLPPLPDTGTLLSALTAAYGAARSLWLDEGETIGRQLQASALSQVLYKSDKLPQWFAELDAYFTPAEPALSTPAWLNKLTPEALEKGARKNAVAPKHPFFNACRVLLEANNRVREHFELKLVDIKRRLLEYCNVELPTRKQKRGLLSYNDLLNLLAGALDADHGAHLATVIRERYPAALIDEFQDTDPVQYHIFRTIYADSGLPVFFVGDPKQAIYGFRGADVFSYLEARDQANSRFTLTTNQRSVPKLIEAVNALFEASPNPFLLKAIDYSPVKPAEKARPTLHVEDYGAEPLRFALMPPRYNDKGEAMPWGKGEANEFAAAATASEITRLLNLAACGKARLVGASTDRPLSGGDIAILVPSHRQGRLLQDALVRRGIPSVRQGQDNVLASAEAVELERLLLAIAEPQRESRIKAALATELVGMDGARIFALENDDSAWEKLLDDFIRYRDIWRNRGFMSMFRRWIEEDRSAERLLRYRDGERRLTNLLHLAELLQVASHEKPGADSLLGWFSRSLRAPDTSDEETLLRLESDADRVKIVTIHTSKGLEYPIVFCPFLWDGKLWQKNELDVCFHDPARNYRPVLNLGGPGIALDRVLASQEKLADKLRLLYVALSRAVHYCHIVWGHVKEMETSALAWLLHGPDEATDDPLGTMQSLFKLLGYADLEKTLRDFAARTPDAVTVGPIAIDTKRYVTVPAVPRTLQALSFKRGSLRPSWQMTSFSALARGRHSEAPDYDAPRPTLAEAALDGSIFAFPRGATAGRCLHAIFEEWDFGIRDTESLSRLVRRKLKAHALSEVWAPALAGMVETTLNAPLDASGLRLADIGRRQRLAELEFTYPLQAFEPSGLRRILADPALGLPKEFAEASRALSFETVKGYMKGFIDLTFEAGGRFYLADYKSNWLGNRPQDYSPARLIQAMAREHYYLQYLVYCLALHRFLKLRLPDYDCARHFGGVFYLFLRGIDPHGKADTGIFRDHPEPALIEKLDQLLS